MSWLEKLPSGWAIPWLELATPDWAWDLQRTPFVELGTDTFLTVSPGGSILYTADASVINQITSRRNDFPKPIYLYGSLDLYGKNVVSTEGQIWRQHRKITSPPFTEKNNHMVWAESIHQAQTMLTSWVGTSGQETRTITGVADDAMRLSLHVISRAGFGVRLLWPGVEDVHSQEKEGQKPSTPGNPSTSNVGVGGDHTLSYTSALQSLLHNILWVLLMPRFLLSKFHCANQRSFLLMYLIESLPYSRTQVAYEAYVEWGKYMREMFQAKKSEMAAGTEQEGMDLMGALVKGAGMSNETLNASSSIEKGQSPPKQALTDDEIIGNAFVFILAGHETAANSIHFSLLNLALNLSSQRHLQTDLDQIFQGRPISEWDYERDSPKLFGGMAGAVLAEELRLVPPVTLIPKSTFGKSQPQSLTVNDKKCFVPGNVLINLSSIGVHRNPKFWPSGPPSDPAHPIHPTSNTDNNLEEFIPERWLISETPDSLSSTSAPHHHDAIDPSADTDDLGVNTASDTSASLYHPPKGAYIPFSEGFRACLGRRFAQVEVLAVLAVIFSQYSVELAVDEFATDEEVAQMSAEEKALVWFKAADKARWLMRCGMGTILTLQMRKGVVPLRFVKRGEERFVGAARAEPIIEAEAEA